MNAKRRVWFVANRKARQSAALFQEATERLRETAELVHAELVPPSEMRRAIRRGLEENPDVLAVGGGDGTLGMAASEMVGRPVALGVFPLGTGNAFARDLGLPRSAAKLAEIVAGGDVEPVDVGVAGDRVFTNLVSIGLAVAISRSLDKRLKKQVGQFAYLGALATALPSTRPFHLRMRVDDEEIETMAVQVAVGPGRFHGGPIPLKNDASLVTGQLAGYVMESLSLGDVARTAIGSFSAMGEHFQASRHFEADRVEILEPLGKAVNVDGERCLRTPVTLQVRAAALKVCVPEGFREEQLSR